MTIGIAPNDLYHNSGWYNRNGKPLGLGEPEISIVSSRPSGRAQVGDILTVIPPDGYVIETPGIFINKGAGYVSLAAALTFTLTSSELPTEGVLWPIIARGTVVGGPALESSPIFTGIQVGPTALTFPQITGVVRAGDTLTVIGGTFAGSPAPTVIRSFWLNGELIARGSTYTLSENTTGSVIVAMETATNAVGSVSVTSSGVRIQPALVVVPTLRGITSHTLFPNQRSGPTTNCLFHSTETVYEDHTQLQLYYDMSYSVSETAATGTTTMTLSIEYPPGSGIQFEMTQGGNETMTGASGGRLVTDLVTLPFTILAGTDFRIKGAANNPSGICLSQNGSAATYGATYDLVTASGVSVLGRNKTDSAAVWNARTNDAPTGTTSLKPSAVIGYGTIPCLFICGDSRSAGGSGDRANDTHRLMGAAERSIGLAYPYINMAQSTDRATNWVDNIATAKRFFYSQFTQGLAHFQGTNDQQALTFAQMVTTDAALIAKFDAVGSAELVIGCTLPPFTSDASLRFYSVASQTASGSAPDKALTNANRLTNPAFSHVVDHAPLAADITVPSKWKVSPTARIELVSTTAGSDVVTGTGFLPEDQGKLIAISGAGTDLPNNNMLAFFTYVSAVSGLLKTGAGLPKNAVNTVAGANGYFPVWYGTEDGIHESALIAQSYQAIGLTERL